MVLFPTLQLGSTRAFAVERTLSGSIAVDILDCTSESITKVYIDGAVYIRAPGDDDAYKTSKQISINCPALEFRPGAKIYTFSNLNVFIKGLLAGDVLIEGTRGVTGKPADKNEDIWKVRKAQNGSPVGGGNAGGDGAECHRFGHGAEQGHPGPPGNPGVRGQDGLPGNDGYVGANGAHIYVVAGSFGSGTKIELKSVGGQGGAGGLGGQGENGGDGGKGGTGGKGGSGRSCHDPARGGVGGRGGDGGDGGNGGRGGNGGDGGRGGDLTVGLLSGGQLTAAPSLTNDGGPGGPPGSGGSKGKSGAGGPGGDGGQGGNGDIFHGGGERWFSRSCRHSWQRRRRWTRRKPRKSWKGRSEKQG